jgi:magnesium transporter
MNGEAALAHAFVATHPRDAAELLERELVDERAALFEGMPAELAGEVIAHMETLQAGATLLAMEPACAGAIVATLPRNAAVRILRRMDGTTRQSLLVAVGSEAAGLDRALQYPPESAGALLDVRGLSFGEALTAAEAWGCVRRAPRWSSSYVYVVDGCHAVTGVCSLRELLVAADDAPLAHLMHRDVSWVPANADRSAIVAHPGWARFHELPVVDDQRLLLGVIRYETVRRLERELTTSGWPAASPLLPFVAVSELYWVGMARILGGLIGALGSQGKPDMTEGP